MRIFLQWLTPALLGLTIAGILGAVHYWRQASLAMLSVRAADFWTVHPNGPRIGRRDASDDIVLVMYDLESATKLGFENRLANDSDLYRRLVKAGASVVYDTRIAACSTEEDFENLKPMLDTLVQLDCVAQANSVAERADNGQIGQTRVAREFWISTNLLTPEDIQRYGPVAVSNVVNAHPQVVPAVRPRLYPLIHQTNMGVAETAPLVIARHVWNVPHPDTQALVEEMFHCGIMSEWHRQNPGDVIETHETRDLYHIGDHGIVWHPVATIGPLVPPAGFWVSYDPDVSQYRTISYLEVMNSPNLEDLGLAGKIVIVGFSIDTDHSSDTYEVPSGTGKAMAAEMLAASTQTLLDGRNFRTIPQWLHWGLLLLGGALFAAQASWLRPLAALALSVALLAGYLVTAGLVYRTGWYMDFLVFPVAAMISGIAGGALGAWRSHRSHGRIVDMFGRYVPRAVVNQLLLQPDLENLELGGTKREVTVLFADIRGFTSFSESLPPEKVVNELNSLLEVMVECTFAHQGTLDKFIGDAILVLFNAPLHQPDHLQRAVAMAVDLQNRLHGHSSRLGVGIGIHVGQAVVGNIGTPQRMEYTAIGNTVNVASRLCDIAKSGSIVVSRTVAAELSEQFERTSLGAVSVKGISQPLEAWSIHQPTTPES